MLKIFLHTGLFLMLSYNLTLSQSDTIKLTDGELVFRSYYDNSSEVSYLTIEKKGKRLYYEEFRGLRLVSLFAQDLDGDNNKEYITDLYTGGAHCCNIMMIAKVINKKYQYVDSIYWGNAGYEIKDLNNDGRLEIVGSNDMFAYAFTNYAQSYFSIEIYTFKSNKLYLANKNFPDAVEAHIEELKHILNKYIERGFDCPATDDEETFNTDAGAVKAILAPIVADYHTIGKVSKGFEFIRRVYRCPDSDKFINILKEEYKLK